MSYGGGGHHIPVPPVMKVKKRSGVEEDVAFDKITNRLNGLATDLPAISADVVAQKVCASIYDGIATSRLDELASEVAIAMSTTHIDYATLAARIVVSDLHKKTPNGVLEPFQIMYDHHTNGIHAPLIDRAVLDVVSSNTQALEDLVEFDRDYGYEYFGIKTLCKSYLTKVDGNIVERPQIMLLRVAIGIWFDDMPNVVRTYILLSDRVYTHATPTLFNAGTPRPQLASCFLSSMEDSVEGIFDTIKQCAMISKHAGGIGLHLHAIRARGSFIRGTNGQSSGVLPLLRTLNNVTRYIDQGGRRPGSIAVYLSPDHADIFDFLRARLNSGSDDERAVDL